LVNVRLSSINATALSPCERIWTCIYAMCACRQQDTPSDEWDER